MPRKLFVALVAGALLIASVPAVSASWGGDHDDDRYHHGRDLNVVGLTDNGKLISFEDDDPGDAEKIGRIKGLDGDDSIVGIDYRPATRDLYGLGNNGGVYVIDDGNARAALKSRLSVPLSGSSFGVDFNPVVDRLRIVSDTGQNLRDNVDADGDTLVDGTLTYPGPPPATAMGVTGAAYTNNDSDPNTATTLFDIDSMLDQTVIQSPANSGMLAATGKLTVDTGPAVGFDIYSTVRGGTAVDVEGFASLTVDGRSGFYAVDLLSGRASSRGSFKRKHGVIDIAVPLNQR